MKGMRRKERRGTKETNVNTERKYENEIQRLENELLIRGDR